MAFISGAVSGTIHACKHLTRDTRVLVRYHCDESDIVACSGNYGHQYPFIDFPTFDVLEGIRIMWGFMKNYSSTSQA